MSEPIVFKAPDLRAAFEQIFGPVDWEALTGEPAMTADQMDAEDRAIQAEISRRDDLTYASPGDCDQEADRHLNPDRP